MNIRKRFGRWKFWAFYDRNRYYNETPYPFALHVETGFPMRGVTFTWNRLYVALTRHRASPVKARRGVRYL